MRLRWLRRFKEVWGTKRGASTVEYVIVIAVAALLATVLYLAINNDGAKGTIATALRNALEGQIGKGYSVALSGRPPNGNSPGSNGSTPVSHTGNGSDVTSKASPGGVSPSNPAGNPSQEGKSWYEEVWNYLISGWDGPEQAWQRTEEDWNRMWADPGQYWSEVFGLEEIKQTVNRIITNPGQYVKGLYNRAKEEVKNVVEDPGGAFIGLLKDLNPVADWKAAWNGVDPETGEKLSIPGRIWRGVQGIPLLGTTVKEAGKEEKIGIKVLFEDKKGCACPHGNIGSGHSKGKGLQYPMKVHDLDWRGTGKTWKDAVDYAFKQLRYPREWFTVTKWAKDANGKSFPVEWKGKKGTPAQYAEVNIDFAHDPKYDNGEWATGPDAPHVGYQDGKRENKITVHIILDSVPFGRDKEKN